MGMWLIGGSYSGVVVGVVVVRPQDAKELAVEGDIGNAAGVNIKIHGNFEGSLWILGSGPKATLPEAETEASI